LKRIFFDEFDRLRNGWWILIYLGLTIIASVLLGSGARFLRHLGVGKAWFEPFPFLITLAAAWAVTKRRGESLASLGWRLDRRWLAELAWGTALGVVLIALAAGLTWAAGGVGFELDPRRAIWVLLRSFYAFFLVALFEESLFRGFCFQRMVDGLGPWGAQLVLAALFALAHWGNQGMQGGARVWGTLNIALAAVLLGLAYLRTRSLALPVGIHLGWNWAQGSVFGFSVSGTGVSAGWLHPVLRARPDWMTGGNFGLEASVFGLVAVMAGIALLWSWRRAPAV
jgi:uncharacterized protein